MSGTSSWTAVHESQTVSGRETALIERCTVFESRKKESDATSSVCVFKNSSNGATLARCDQITNTFRRQSSQKR